MSTGKPTSSGPSSGMSMALVAAVLAAVGTMTRGQTASETTPRPRAGRASSREERGVTMAKHSFEKTLTYDDNLKEWMSSASSMALRDRFQLLPPVPDRYGCFFHKEPLRTREFQVSFSFHVRSQGAGAADSTFAFWIGADNFTAGYNEQQVIAPKDWGQGLANEGLTFLGNKPAFKGIAIVFLGIDKNKDAKPSVTAILNDGKSARQLLVDVPAASDTKDVVTKYVQWKSDKATEKRSRIGLADKTQVQIKLRNGALVGSLKVGLASSFSEVFNLPISAVDLANYLPTSEAYIGFTGWSGKQLYDEINIMSLDVKNFDRKRFGEEESDVLGENSDKWLKMLEEEKRYIDQKSQKDAVVKLTELLADHVKKYDALGAKAKADLLEIESRLEKLNSETTLFKNKVHAYLPGNHIDPNVFKDHISGLREIFSKDKTHHTKMMKEVHDTAKEIKEKPSAVSEELKKKVVTAAANAQTLSEEVNKSSKNTNVFLFLIILCVSVFGFLFRSRMVYYEKKHYI
eukprot:gnl/TRDRNA2_/TRDRNA2_133745_c0_seq1.p1 gnl/TRDRNA2_/TRDRNA2_133745_c0~~gnl/TRDRNA2_/TRDRNA2_133745_c0_seq1.p1  ORF type:complete len:517 (+),score=130.80 gnl/TRDRNA2_/TRDRNA2_133745_c0_seq1:46-1596(+)